MEQPKFHLCEQVFKNPSTVQIVESEENLLKNKKQMKQTVIKLFRDETCYIRLESDSGCWISVQLEPKKRITKRTIKFFNDINEKI